LSNDNNGVPQSSKSQQRPRARKVPFRDAASPERGGVNLIIY
jgi:hypothetical protein